MRLADEMRTLISQHLDDLAENRLPNIQKKTGYSIDLIKETREQLHQLNPKPGAALMEVFVPVVTPDVVVELDENGEYQVRLVDDSLPPLRISEYYRKRLSDPTSSEEEREFIKRRSESAQWLIESIQQRRRTLTRVTQEIVSYQRKFLDQGQRLLSL